MSYSELIGALENIIIDKVATVPAARIKKNDTSAPMEIGMAAREDGEGASQEADQTEDHGSRSASCLQRNWQRKVDVRIAVTGPFSARSHEAPCLWQLLFLHLFAVDSLDVLIPRDSFAPAVFE